MRHITVCSATGFFDIVAFIEGFEGAFGITANLEGVETGVGVAFAVVGGDVDED